ncbi:MAG: ABC transporter ATP-binding protein [Candidatus Delongbacteria bacterium]|nr:ABC transporter ATP-binding protein [Candidatus Delongbacteria bacterium]MBN2835368.1 ABC transporter ATP-binding protein [Candidatus Delongbacteria bacterium]
MNKIYELYKIVLNYKWYLFFGIISMIFFAAFSISSLGLLKPLLDYVFPTSEQVVINQYQVPSTNTIYEYPKIEEYRKIDTFWLLADEMKSVISRNLENESLISLLTDKSKRGHFGDSLGDVLIRTDKMLLLYTISVIAFILTLIKSFFFYSNKFFFSGLQGLIVKELRGKLFRTYMNQSISFINGNRVGDAIVRINSDVQQVCNYLVVSIFGALRDFTIVVFSVIVILQVNMKLFFYSLALLPFFTILLTHFGKKIKKYGKRMQKKYADLFSNVEQSLNNMKVIKAFAKEEFEEKEFDKKNETFYRFWRKGVLYSATSVPISEINGIITTIIILLMGGSMVISKDVDFTFGDFSVFLVLMLSMLHPLKTISNAYTDIKKGMVSLDRIFEIFDMPEIIDDPKNPVEEVIFKNEIKFENVSFGYDNNDVLNNFNLSIKKGEKVALVGSSGSGKSTAALLLLRMFDPNSGSITLDGVDIRNFRQKKYRSIFGTVTQEPLLFHTSIYENIAYGAQVDPGEEKVVKAANIAYADEFIDKMSKSYKTMLNPKGNNLSGGQKQRLCIARALVNDPDVLIFDEATSALDTVAENYVQKAIDKATENRTVVIIAHRLSTILDADKIVVLSEGKIAGAGTHAELLENCEEYQKLYRMQFN